MPDDRGEDAKGGRVMSRLASLVVMLCLLAACSEQEPYARRFGSSVTGGSLDAQYERSIRPSSFRAVLPAEAGQSQLVGTYRQGRSVLRREALDGDGDPANPNVILVVAGPRYETNLGYLQKPREQEIARDMRQQFPGVQMRVIREARSNNYGPYGLAVGASDRSGRCIFAWQWIDNYGPGSGATTQDASAISIRLRLCRHGASLDQLASLFDHMRIVETFDDQPPILTAARSEPPVRSRSAVDKSGADKPVAQTPEPQARQRAASRPSSSDVKESRQGVQPFVAGDGRVYLALPEGNEGYATRRNSVDVTNSIPQSGRSTSGGSANGVTGSVAGALDSSLPPEAYRGPRS
jgi:hypothetical protein